MPWPLRSILTVSAKKGAAAFEPVHINVKGPGRLIGPVDRSLLGGEAVFWVASIGEPGEMLIEITGPDGLPEPGRATLSLEIDVELDND